MYSIQRKTIMSNTFIQLKIQGVLKIEIGEFTTEMEPESLVYFNFSTSLFYAFKI